MGMCETPTGRCAVSGSGSWPSDLPLPAASWPPAGPSAPGGSC